MTIQNSEAAPGGEWPPKVESALTNASKSTVQTAFLSSPRAGVLTLTFALPLALALAALPGCSDDDGSNGPQPHYSGFADWVECDEEADDGATRDFYNRAAALPWRNYLGDYHDADNVPQGPTPFASTTLSDDDTPEYVEWEVANLVQLWVDGAFPNKGFYLIGTTPGGPFNFYSREHPDETQRPELVVETADGPVTLWPEVDTFLETSTYQCFGQTDNLRLSDENPILLRFDLSAYARSTPITRAVLRLFVYEEYGGSDMQAGVFRCSQGHELPPEDPQYGIAADYPDDAGILDHPDVLLFTDFESPNWGDDWTHGASDDTLTVVSTDPDRLFEPFQGSALRATIPGGDFTGLNLGFGFADKTGAEPEEIFFRYYVRIADDWNPVDGGKFPGISGTYGVAGWGGRPSDGTNGWSARGSYHVAPPDSNPLAGMTPLGHYVYHAEMEGQYGDIYNWIDGYRGFLEKNRWYSVEQYLRMNTPGQNDGIIRSWVDGRPAFEKTDFMFRTVDTLKIEKIWMNIYHGGTTPIPQDSSVYIDNVVIARSYIGPMYRP